jgi:hypothetical protein
MTVLVLVAGCSKTNSAATPDGQAAAATESTTKPAPDNSEVTTKVDANGVKTQERVFRNNPRIARVVVTTNNGSKTVKAYSPSGEEREVNKNETEDVLEATGDKVADAAGFVANKGEDVAGKAKDVGAATKEKTEGVAEKTVDVSKTVANKSVEGATTVKNKSVQGAKTVGSKTVSGAKKAGSAIKKIIP